VGDVVHVVTHSQPQVLVVLAVAVKTITQEQKQAVLAQQDHQDKVIMEQTVLVRAVVAVVVRVRLAADAQVEQVLLPQ